MPPNTSTRILNPQVKLRLLFSVDLMCVCVCVCTRWYCAWCKSAYPTSVLCTPPPRLQRRLRDLCFSKQAHNSSERRMPPFPALLVKCNTCDRFTTYSLQLSDLCVVLSPSGGGKGARVRRNRVNVKPGGRVFIFDAPASARGETVLTLSHRESSFPSSACDGVYFGEGDSTHN